MKYVAPFQNPTGPNDEAAHYVDGNKAAGIEGSVVPAKSLEHPQRELISLIKAGAMVPDDTDLDQVHRSVRGQVPSYAIDTGIANALAWMMSPTSGAYRVGMLRRVKVKFANTGPCTGNDSLLGNVPIVHGDGSVMVAGELIANGIIDLVFDGVSFQLISVTQAGGYIGYINAPITKTVYGGSADFPDLPSALYWASRYIITQTGYLTLQITPGQHIENATRIIVDHPNANRLTIQGGTVTPPVSADFVFTGNTGAALSNDQANQLAMLRTKYNTELRLTNTTWMDVRTGGTIQNLLITGDGTFPASPGNSRHLVTFTNDVFVQNLSVHGSGGSGIGVNGARSCFFAGTVTCSGCVAAGLNVYTSMALESIYIGASNNYAGMTVVGSIGWNTGAPIYCQGNGIRGALVTGSCLFKSASVFKNNKDDGLVVVGGYASAGAATYSGNGHVGIEVSNGGSVDAYGSTFSANGVFSVEANMGATCDVRTSTLPGSSLSPVVNTVGNANSYILGT